MVFLLFLTACADQIGSSAYELSEVTSNEALPTEDAGTFGLKMVTSVMVANPLNDDQSAPSQTTSWSLATLRRDGTAVAWTDELCGLETTEVFGTQTIFPNAFVETMPIRERTMTLSAARVGATAQSERYIDLNGADLERPDQDRLPANPNDDRVWDQDEDGQPGLTIHIHQNLLGEGEIYVVQRSTTCLDGVVISPDRIEGYVEAESEQVVLDASTFWLKLDTPAGQSDPNPQSSHFILQRMADGATCADVMSQRERLF